MTLMSCMTWKPTPGLHNVINEHPEVLNRMRPYSFRH